MILGAADLVELGSTEPGQTDLEWLGQSEPEVDLSRVRVAIVHEWLEVFAGSERVLEHLLHCFPQADLFAVVDFMPPEQRTFLAGRPVKTTFIQKMPFARKHFRQLLPLMPLAVEQFDMSGYDLVISSNHAVAKGVITGPDQFHVSYVHSPMRYAWDLQAQYLRERRMEHGWKSFAVRWLLHRLRLWDVRSAVGVDLFLANSNYIARRIRKAYRRESIVVPPPVAVERFVPSAVREDYYLVVSRFVAYKRVDLIVEAFAGLPGSRLIVVGSGDCAAKVAKAAAGHGNIELLEPVGSSELVSLMSRARAFVFAAEEDFGITMVEAQACGTPVIAYGVGGACDIVVENGNAPTGVLFGAQTVAALQDAVRCFEARETSITSADCRRNAMRFSEALFHARVKTLVAAELAHRNDARARELMSNSRYPSQASTDPGH